MDDLDLEEWVARWRAPLTGFLAGRGLDARTAVEAAEETFAEAWVGRHTFRGDPQDDADVGAWLRGIARNRARTALRAARRHEPIDAEVDPATTPPVEDRHARLRAAVDQLPDRERAAVLAFYFGEATTLQVAALLGASTRAVEGLLHRARRRLAGQVVPAETT